MTEELTIQPARPEDVEPAVALTIRAFPGVSIDHAIEEALGRAGESWQEIKGRQVRQEFQRWPEHAFVARLNGQFAGYVTNEVSAAMSRGRILNLAVDERFRGRGIARRLLERSLEHFRSLGLKQAKIETLATNQVGRHLYPSLGFQEVSQQVHFAMNL